MMRQILLSRASALFVIVTFLVAVVADGQQPMAECEIDTNTGSCVADIPASSSWGDLMKQIFGGNENGEVRDDIQKENPTFQTLVAPEDSSSEKERSESIWDLLQWGNGRKEEGGKRKSAEPEIDDAWEQILIEGAKARAQQQQGQTGIEQKIKIVTEFFGKVGKQFEKAFDGLDLGRFDLLQAYYYLQHEESVKNPSWKRRNHRYLDAVTVDQALALSDALYMNAVAYADTCQEIEDYLKDFRNHSWFLLNCTTESTPLKPAHFLAVRRRSEEQQINSKRGFTVPWSSKMVEETTLEVAFVVRATKDIMDMLTDALLESVPYNRGGAGALAHDGIMQSAVWLYEQYKDFLSELLDASKRDKLKLWTLGYSLGAGAAALLTIEFNENENDKIESHSLGFGTPAIVTRNLSESTKSTITTVINDADCVSRMSGPALCNAFLRGVSYNYTNDALEDLNQLVPFLKENLPLGNTILSDETVAKLRSNLADSLKVKFASTPIVDLPKELRKIELFPPGKCIHIYREPGGWAGHFTPCHHFNEIEVIDRMVDDHLLDSSTGYGPTLLNYIRQLKDDWNWKFDYDMMDLSHMKESHEER